MSQAPRDEATASVYLARALLAYATKQGLDSREICDVVGLTPVLLEDVESRISLKVFNAIWAEAVRRSRDESFGLHFGADASIFSGGHVLYSVMLNCPTLGEAIERFCRYHGLMAEAVAPRLRVEGDRVAIALAPVHSEATLVCHQSEAVLATIASLLRGLVEGGLPLLEVCFGHPRPRQIVEQQKFFGCRLRFGMPANELIIARDNLSRRLALPNPELRENLEQFADVRLARLSLAAGWAGKVRGWLGPTLAQGGKPALASVARELAVSGRQLQSRLKEEGTTYQMLLDGVRKELAVSYLKQGNVTLCELAFLLGYSEQSAFNHAFKRWTGSTPGEVKRSPVTRLDASR